MTMTPEEFHERFSRAVADAPPPVPVEHDLALARGRLALRRRRLASAVTAGVAVVAVAGGSFLAFGSGARESSGPAVAPSATASSGAEQDAELLEGCRTGELQEPSTAQRFFSSGTPVVKSTAAASTRTSAALESADGKLWAWCRIDAARPDTNGMDVYTAGGDRPPGLFYYYGPDCANDVPQDRCDTFMLRWTERLPEPVARIDLVMGNGEVVEIEGVDGFFVLEYRGPLPAGVRADRTGSLPLDFKEIREFRYLDRDGKLLAGEDRENGANIGQPLRRYPFVGAQVVP